MEAEARKRKEAEHFERSVRSWCILRPIGIRIDTPLWQMENFHSTYPTYWSMVGEARLKTEQARYELDMLMLEYSIIGRKREETEEIYEKLCDDTYTLCEDVQLSD